MQRDLGFKKGGVYKWNEFKPSTPAVQKMSAYFGKSMAYILDGEDELEAEFDIKSELNRILLLLKDNSNIVYGESQLSELSKQILIDNIQNTIGVADKCQNA